MLEAPHYSATGAKRKAFRLPADPFDGTVNEAALHQAVVTYLANQRQGTHATKTKALVSGGGRKPWRQKGTGRARHGSIRAPQWRGGGVVFGPQPRDHRLGLPRKARRLARRSALNARAREGAVYVIEGFPLEGPKTRVMAELLGKIGVAGQRMLILTAGHNEAVYLSARNIPLVEVRAFAEATAYEVLRARTLLIEERALTGGVTVAGAEATPATPRRRKPAAKPQRGAGRSAAARGKAAGAKPAKRARRKGSSDA